MQTCPEQADAASRSAASKPANRAVYATAALGSQQLDAASGNATGKPASNATAATGDMPEKAGTPAQQAFELKAPASPKKASKAGAPRAEVVQVLDFFNAEWVKTRCPPDGKPPTCYAADFAQLRTFIGKFGVDGAKQFIQRFLDDHDPWLVRLGHPLRMLPIRVDGYRSTTTTPSANAVGSRDLKRGQAPVVKGLNFPGAKR
jgi:hypothetical protein